MQDVIKNINVYVTYIRKTEFYVVCNMHFRAAHFFANKIAMQNTTKNLPALFLHFVGDVIK